MKKYFLHILLVIGSGLLISSVVAQEEEDEEIYELSPFEVDSRGDSGYMATHTLAGTRLNTSLKDVASSVSVFTEQFIEDLGAQSIEELANYTTNMYVYYDEDNAPGVTSDRISTTANNIVQSIRIRGVSATQGMDYFRSITPSDGYRIGRYDVSRGPNSILFGLSHAGGIVGSTSLRASTFENFGEIQIIHENTGGLRGELRANRVVIPEKLAIIVAAVKQDNEEWQVGTWDDSERVFAAATLQVNDRLTLRANFESGSDNFSNQSQSPALDFGGQAFYDWARYLLDTEGSIDRLLLTPRNNNNPAGAERANFPAGLRTQRNSGSVTASNNSGNRRYVFVANDGAFYDSSGSFFFRSYGDRRVSAPPDANWVNGSAANGARPRINQPDLFPRTLNTDGPGAYKNYDFNNYSFFADFEVSENFFVNLSHNYQEIDLLAYNIGGFAFQVNADNNKTRGLGENFYGEGHLRNPGFGPNPYAGMWYLESNWRRDVRTADLEATRLQAVYEFDTGDWAFHRVAAMASRTEEFDWRTNQQLGLLERPYSSHWNNPANRVEVRTYFDFDDPVQNPESFHIGHWDQLLGNTYTLDDRFTGEPREVEIGWTNRIPGGGNKAGKLTIDTQMMVAQNYWFDRKLVTTFGFRKDESDIRQFYNPWSNYDNVNVNPDDPIQTNVNTPEELIYGPVPEFDSPELDDQFVFDSETTVMGAVYHLTDNFSLVANFSDSIGFPDFNRTLFPTGIPTPPPQGEGLDYGINFELFDRRVSGRLAYYETDETGISTGLNNAGQYDRLVDTAALVVPAGIMTQAEWSALDAEELYDRRDHNGDLFDKTSRGVEFTIVANITNNWRLVFKTSKVDRINTNVRKNMERHFGLLPDPDSPAEWDLVVDPFDRDTETIDPNGFNPDGVFAQLYGHLSSLLGTDQAGGATRVEDIVTVGNNNDVFTDWEIIVRNFNDNRIGQHKRWGLRPYKANVFSVYDFTEGFLQGLSIGGGVSWESEMIIGEDEQTLEEWRSRELWNVDPMVRYRWKNGIGPFSGPFTVQLNVYNALDDQKIKPVAYMPARGPRWELPYDRGYAYARYDVPAPRSWRLSATYEF